MMFFVGNKVIERQTIRPHTSYNILQVVGYLDKDLLVKHWGFGFDGEEHQDDFGEEKPGSRSYREGILRFQDHELCSVSDALAEQKQMEAAKSKIDEDFEKVRGEIHAKLQRAAALVREAGELAKPYDKSLDDLKNECTPLYLSLDENGWRHSNMRC